MLTKLSFDDLPGENTKNFQGRDYGATASFYLAVNEPGTGPPLHRHPYDETFIVQEGTVTFTVEGEQLEASAGEIVIVPANAAHRFENTGDGMLRQVNIHPQDHMVQEDLE